MALTDTPVTSENLTATTATPQVATTVTTFSPGAGSTVIVRLSWLQGGGGTPTTITVKDSLGNTYSTALAAANSFNVAGSGIYYFTYPSGATSIHLVISSSATNANTGGLEVLVSPSVTTGAGATPAFGPNTINIAPSGPTTTLVTNLTTTVTGSQVYLAGGIQTGSTGTVNANTTQTAAFAGFNNAFTGKATSLTGTPGSTAFGWTISPSAAFGGNMLAVELLPSSGTTVTSTGSASLAPVKAGGTGAAPVVVSGSAHLAAMSATGTVNAGAAPSGPFIAQDGGALLAQDGGALVSQGATGGITSTGSASMATMTAGGSATQVTGVVVNGSASLGAMKAGGTAAAPVIATGSASLAAMTAHGTAAETITATGSASLGAMTATGTNAELIATSGSAHLAAMTAGGTVVETISSTGSASLAVMGAGGTGAAPVVVSGSASLAVMKAQGSSGSGTVTVAGTWTAGHAIAAGFFFPFPAARPLQLAITNTPGDWVLAIVAWRPSPGAADVSVTVADDAHNWWEPVGAPATDSGAAGAVRTAVWAAPAARVANTVTGVTQVQVAPTGPVLSMALTIIDVNGPLPWYQVAAITTGFSNGATSLALSSAAPSDRALLIAAFASDDNSKTLTGPSGWTALTAAAASNGTDHTADIFLTPAYQVTTGSASASLSASGALDLAGVIAGVLISAPEPVQPNPKWPVMTTEVAIGAGIATPPSEMTWTPLSGRSLSLDVTQGKQYSLGQLQAGTGTLLLDDPDGALIPPGTGAYAGIDSGTPVRRRVMWPGLPGSPALSPHYVAFNGFVRRWPFNLDSSMYRGQVQAEVTDAWGYGNGLLNAMAVEECLLDSPNSLWPLTDAPGSTGAGNLIANGPGLNLAVSKFGAGGAVITWGANSGALIGMSSAQVTASGATGGASGMFQQALSGASLSTVGFGYALTASSQAYPPVAGGVTMECFAQLTVGATQRGGTALTSPMYGGTDSLPAGQAVILSVVPRFTFPTGPTAGQIYFTLQEGTKYDLATSPGGAPVVVTVNGSFFITPTLPWNPVILAARSLGAPVCGLEVDKNSGALSLRYRPAGATVDSHVTVDAGTDYRNTTFLRHFSLSFNRTSWRVLVDGGQLITASGTFTSPLPATFTDASFGGVMDRTSQGLNWPGFLGGPAGIYPGFSPQVRVINRYESARLGLTNEAACDRVERLLEYGGLTGRRWLGQQQVQYEGDLVASGQDVGGQAAVSSVSNVTASTAPAIASVAPTGDITYLSKLYTWNQPVRWTLGDNTAAGEIPFQVGVATDYDPARVTADVQLTQLDSQSVTTPNGVMAATTMAAVAQVAGRQYGGQPYQQTGYLEFDWSSAYNAGGSLVDNANWVQAVFAKPQNRVQSVTVNAASHPEAWPFWAGAAVGDMVSVTLRLPTASVSPLISLTARITQTARSSQFSQDGTSATIAATLDFAPEYQALTCDDPVRGLLDGKTAVLPWLTRCSPPCGRGRPVTWSPCPGSAPTSPTRWRCSRSRPTSSARARPGSRSPAPTTSSSSWTVS